MVFNTAENNIGNADGHPTVLDLLVTALHEFGHVMGMPDYYSSSCCSTSIMCGRIGAGDISKRTIDNGTKQCVAGLYAAASTPAPAPSPPQQWNIAASPSLFSLLDMI